MVLVVNKKSGKSDLNHFLETIEKRKEKKGFDAKKYCGKIKLKEHPLEIQKRLRDEFV
jgi:diacylglycerol kinase family enzyme